ncbi:hypothetical protein [Streptacidiphilus sp. PAMC 29251]
MKYSVGPVTVAHDHFTIAITLQCGTTPASITFNTGQNPTMHLKAGLADPAPTPDQRQAHLWLSGDNGPLHQEIDTSPGPVHGWLVTTAGSSTVTFTCSTDQREAKMVIAAWYAPK